MHSCVQRQLQGSSFSSRRLSEDFARWRLLAAAAPDHMVHWTWGGMIANQAHASWACVHSWGCKGVQGSGW